jgi:hypothetical protein
MVDTSKINEWLQVVGMFGVIASLIFVGLQMKQTQQIALSGTYQARSAVTVESLVAIISSPEFLSASARIYAGKSDELTMQEAVAWEYFLGAEMTSFENNHQQYEMGFLSEEHWQRNVAELKCKFELPLNRQMMENWFYRESFMIVIEEIIDQVSENRTCGWDYDWPYSATE